MFYLFIYLFILCIVIFFFLGDGSTSLRKCLLSGHQSNKFLWSIQYTDNFPSLNANDWTDLILEDERFNYTLYGNGRVVEEGVVLYDGEVSLPPEDTDEQ